jgi:ADP-ribose pyrophosphatase YjhB (NUDIX family)
MLTVRHKPGMPQIYFDVIRPFQKLYWYLFRPYRPGVKTLVFYEGKLLLVRIGYLHKKWVLPGGGIDRGEEPSDAARREVREESGVDIVNLTYIGQEEFTQEYKRVTVFYFTSEAASADLIIDGQEIVDAGWFPLDALPADIAPRVPRQITLYNEWKNTKI